MRHALAAVPTTALLVSFLAGCGDSSGSSNTGPPAELTASVGAVARDEADAALNALTLPTLLTPIGAGNGSPCVSPSSTTDSDGDGIPDDATWIFTAPPCRFTDYRGGTLDLVGQLRIQDSTPTTAGFGYEATIVALRAAFTPQKGDAYSITRNGTRSLAGSVAGLQLTANLQVIRTFTGLSDAAVDEQWTVQFTPETSLQINKPLPSGTLVASGTFGWARGTESIDLTITTPTPLHYDAGCDDTRRIDAGELDAAGTFAGTAGHVRVRWSACGQDPEITFVSG
jgi:hypothetical protein